MRSRILCLTLVPRTRMSMMRAWVSPAGGADTRIRGKVGKGFHACTGDKKSFTKRPGTFLN